MTSPEHDRGVAAAERWMRGQGFQKEEFPDTGGSRPDTYGEQSLSDNHVKRMLIEVETCDSLDEEQSANQMEDFARWAAKHSSRRLVLFVPRECLLRARSKLPKYKEYEGF